MRKYTVKLGACSDLEMVTIPVDAHGTVTFQMGSPPDEDGRFDDETQHEVTLSGYQIGAHLVTQGQWEAIMGSNQSHFRGPNRPVECVSWDDATEFCRRLTELTGGPTWRLPTEAEWECACRAGTTGPRYGNLVGIAAYGRTAAQGTAEVGGKAPNAWGLYDTLGNVWEWCADWHGPYTGDDIDPRGPDTGTSRVVRGGGWYGDGPGHVRGAMRYYYAPAARYIDIGFRCIRDLS